MNKKIKTLLGCSSVLAALSLTTPMFTSCSVVTKFVFGNFQSYMSPEVKQDIDKHLKNVNWQNFTSNDEIPTYLTNKTINTAVASNNMIVKLSKDSMIQKVDWHNFNLLKPDGGIVKNANDLKGVVSDLTYKIATEGFNEFGIDNLLDYCFPYFLQNFVFVYRGEQIPELAPDKNPTFTDIFRVINSEPRFKSTKKSPNVMMIKDSRTMYGVSQILSDEKNNTEININPDSGLLNQPSSLARSIKELTQDYNVLKESIKVRIGLNSDSNVLINKIVLDEIKGAFMYNGDAAFAALGGDYAGTNYNGKKVPFPKKSNFHVVVPTNTLIALDGVVQNSHNTQIQQEESLKVSYDLTMMGSNVSEFNDWNKPLYLSDKELNKLDPKNLNIFEETINPVENGSQYLFLSAKNFQYVNYTPTLQKMANAADAEYFKNYLLALQENVVDQNEITEFSKLIAEIIKIKIPTNKISNLIEKPLNNLTESNMQVAFTELVDAIPG